MKTNEAPNKLYITYKGYGVFDEDSTVERTKDSQTEYTRTDAFIEKACEWLKNNIEKYYYLDEAYDKVISIKNLNNDIKNYMKGK